MKTHELKWITVGELKEALNKHPYLALRMYLGGGLPSYEIGVNSKCKCVALRKKQRQDDQETAVISWRPISFHEYISIKTPFL